MFQASADVLQTDLESRIVDSDRKIYIDSGQAMRRYRLYLDGSDGNILDLLASAEGQHHDRQHKQQEFMCPISHNTRFYIFAKITIFVEKSYLCLS